MWRRNCSKYVPDYGTYEVADHAISLIMNFARGISEYTY